MKKALPITVLILLAAAVIYYWKSCKPGPSRETIVANQRADSSQRALDSFKAVTLPQIAKLQQDTAIGNRRFDSLRRADSVVRLALMAGIRVVKENLTAGDQAAARHDTAAILINWDSLRAQVRAELPIVIQHDELGNEQIQAALANAKVADSLAHYWESLYHKADSAAMFQRVANMALQKDFDRQQFALRIWKPVAIGGAAYVAISILLNSLKK